MCGIRGMLASEPLRCDRLNCSSSGSWGTDMRVPAAALGPASLLGFERAQRVQNTVSSRRPCISEAMAAENKSPWENGTLCKSRQHAGPMRPDREVVRRQQGCWFRSRRTLLRQPPRDLCGHVGLSARHTALIICQNKRTPSQWPTDEAPENPF